MLLGRIFPRHELHEVQRFPITFIADTIFPVDILSPADETIDGAQVEALQENPEERRHDAVAFIAGPGMG